MSAQFLSVVVFERKTEDLFEGACVGSIYLYFMKSTILTAFTVNITSATVLTYVLSFAVSPRFGLVAFGFLDALALKVFSF